MWRQIAFSLLLSSMAIADGPAAPGPGPAADSPAARLQAARALLDARGSHRERRVYSSPNELKQVVEFSGKRQRWIIEFDDDGRHLRQETVWWEGGRSARRQVPGSPQWNCFPPIDVSLTEPQATVTDGGAVSIDGRAAHRYVEEFINESTHGAVKHLVDVDDSSGLPLQLTSTEQDGGVETRYVGTYYDIGAPITIDAPDC